VIEQAILSYLLAATAVTALAGPHGYLLVLPQAPTLVYPCFRVQLISEVEHYTLTDRTNFFPARIQIDAMATVQSGVNPSNPYTQARALSDAIADTLCFGDGFVSNGVDVSSVLAVDLGMDYDPEERRDVRVRRDFIAVYRVL
jgi:hypothetical protein